MLRMPTSTAGKWAVGFGIAFALLMAISLVIAFAIGGDPARVAGNPLIPVLNITLNLAGLLSLILGAFAVIRSREWVVTVALALCFALVALFFLLGEFLFPH